MNITSSDNAFVAALLAFIIFLFFLTTPVVLFFVLVKGYNVLFVVGLFAMSVVLAVAINWWLNKYGR